MLAASCGGEAHEPAVLDVQVAYVSRLPSGCPGQGNPCYPMCAHHNAPAGLEALRLYGRDIGMCCVDACSYPPVLEDILLGGTTLRKVVRDGLPEGVTAALEFSVTGSGAIRQ